MRHTYRYSSSKWNSLLLEKGSIRIGTLHDFRSNEHKSGIADAFEGRKTIHHRGIDINNMSREQGELTGNKDFAALESFGCFVFLDRKSSGTIKNISLYRDFDEDDCFILCSSYRKSRIVMKQFEGADSGVVLKNPRKFYSLVTDELKKLGFPVTFFGQRRVVYKSREEPWNGKDWGSSPALIKEFGFSPQCEVRAIWTLKNKIKIMPQIIESPEIARCFEWIDYPSWQQELNLPLS